MTRRLEQLEQAIQPEKTWITVLYSEEYGYWLEPHYARETGMPGQPCKVDYRNYGRPKTGDRLITEAEFHELEQKHNVIRIRFIDFGEGADVDD